MGVTAFDQVIAAPHVGVHRAAQPRLHRWLLPVQAAAVVTLPTWWTGWHLMDYGWARWGLPFGIGVNLAVWLVLAAETLWRRR